MRRHVPPREKLVPFALVLGRSVWFWSLQSEKEGAPRRSTDSDRVTQSAICPGTCPLTSVLRVPQPNRAGLRSE